MIDAWMIVMYAVCAILAPGDKKQKKTKKNFYMEHPPCLDHVSWKHIDSSNNNNDNSNNIYKYIQIFIICVWCLYMLLFTSFFFLPFFRDDFKKDPHFRSGFSTKDDEWAMW